MKCRFNVEQVIGRLNEIRTDASATGLCGPRHSVSDVLNLIAFEGCGQASTHGKQHLLPDVEAQPQRQINPGTQ